MPLTSMPVHIHTATSSFTPSFAIQKSKTFPVVTYNRHVKALPSDDFLRVATIIKQRLLLTYGCASHRINSPIQIHSTHTRQAVCTSIRPSTQKALPIQNNNCNHRHNTFQLACINRALAHKPLDSSNHHPTNTHRRQTQRLAGLPSRDSRTLSRVQPLNALDLEDTLPVNSWRDLDAVPEDA